MTTLLHIDSSVSPFSSSRAVAIEFADAWRSANPDGTVVNRDLVASPPPPLSWDAVTASMTPADAQSTAQVAAWSPREELITELESADALLLSVPMYNWSIPASVKAWIDNVVANGRTLGTTDGKGVLTGKPVTVITGRGGAYGPGTPMADKDYQQPYLTHVLTSLGATDIEFINIELTMAAVNPAMEHLQPLAERSREEAAKAVAARVARAA